jgi:hypothetical protein
MPDEQVDYLEKQLTKSRCFLEYGAGGSTYLAAEKGVAKIYSVESDVEFARAVRISTRKKFPELDLTILVPTIGPTGKWGMPTDDAHAKQWPSYSTAIWSRIERDASSVDLVLIDGRFRAACFLASLLKAAPGTLILFDDYVGRESRYGVAARHAKQVETIAKMAVFEVGDNLPSKDIAFDFVKASLDPS